MALEATRQAKYTEIAGQLHYHLPLTTEMYHFT